MPLLDRDHRPASPQWMVVYVTYSVPEAHIIAGKLQHEDIPAMVHTQAGAGAIGITIGQLGEVAVLVSPRDYERALQVLEAPNTKHIPDTTDSISYHWIDDEDDEDEPDE